MDREIVPANKYNAIPESVSGTGNEQLTFVAQIGLAVRDLDKAMAEMERVLHVRPNTVNRVKRSDSYYRGKLEAFELRIAFYDFANIEFELIEPVDGQNVWFDHFENNEVALEHVRFNVKDYDGVVADMASKGIEVYQEGRVSLDPRFKWAYFDTVQSLGFVLEILGLDKA